MEFLDPQLDQYATQHTSEEPALLAALNRETWTQVLQPRMLSGHMQGRILSMLSKIHGPKNILEIGTYTGYSALCLAEGLTSDGTLYTIDINEELQPIFQKYFDRHEKGSQIKPLTGNALDIIPTLNTTFDLVFIDADKENYINYYNMILDKVPSGGLIICDNVLWSGKVLKTAAPKDLDTKILQELNQLVTHDDRVENVLMPVRDGLMVIRKK